MKSLFWLFPFLSLIALKLQGQGHDSIPKAPDTVAILTYKIKGKTASGMHTGKIKGPFLAVSRDLLKSYPMFSKVYLYDCIWKGEYQVLDVMNKRYTKTVDIFYKGKKKRPRQKCLCKPTIS